MRRRTWSGWLLFVALLLVLGEFFVGRHNRVIVIQELQKHGEIYIDDSITQGTGL
jgi:hypothetical protein